MEETEKEKLIQRLEWLGRTITTKDIKDIIDEAHLVGYSLARAEDLAVLDKKMSEIQSKFEMSTYPKKDIDTHIKFNDLSEAKEEIAALGGVKA